MYLTLPLKMPSATDRNVVLNIEMHDSSRQRGAMGLTVAKNPGCEGRSGAHLSG